MNKCILITRPEHDDTTYYLSNWTGLVIPEAERSGLHVYDLKRGEANYKHVTGIIKEKSPRLNIFNGHGSDTVITGHKNEVLIEAGKNEQLLKNSIVYAISCKSASVLGEKSVKAGTEVYIGYANDFVFEYNCNMISKPLGDKTAKLFFEPSNEIILSLIKGNSTKEAYEKAKTMFIGNIRKLLTSESSENASSVRWLWWDFMYLKLIGNPSSTL